MAKKLPTVFVKPAPGCMVRDPLTRKFLEKKGEEKPKNTYWLRRIRMKDVIEIGAMWVLGDDVAGRLEDEEREHAPGPVEETVSSSKRGGKGKSK